MAAEETILWRRLDRPGHEAARLSRSGDDWKLAGTAVFAHEGEPCRLDYSILCGSDWRTSEAVVEGWVGHGPSRYRYESAGGRFVAELEVNAAGLVTLYPGFWQAEGSGR